MTQVIQEELPGHPYGVLTGPNLAKEILSEHGRGRRDRHVRRHRRRPPAGPASPPTSSASTRTSDVIGSELGGALKNVIALASGMADGLGAGDNTRAAVITRGLAELTRLGVAMGGQPDTFAGLAGMGDLLATCISSQSRNRHVGEELGKGKTIEQIVEEMDQVAEGVKSARVVLELAEQYGVDMPITAEVASVVGGTAPAENAVPGAAAARRSPTNGD